MLDAKLSLVVVLWRDVVCVEFMLKVQLVEHGGVCALQETGRKMSEFSLKNKASSL